MNESAASPFYSLQVLLYGNSRSCHRQWRPLIAAGGVAPAVRDVDFEGEEEEAETSDLEED